MSEGVEGIYVVGSSQYFGMGMERRLDDIVYLY